MSQMFNSPEIQPSQPEQDFPALETDAVIQPEQVPVGAELTAERAVETDTTDAQAASLVAPVADDTLTVDEPPQGGMPAPVDTSIPDLADDIDVIEKAWVDKAKQIINETKDDPHAQEKAFEQLQIEYHKKRYGRDIKAKR